VLSIARSSGKLVVSPTGEAYDARVWGSRSEILVPNCTTKIGELGINIPVFRLRIAPLKEKAIAFRVFPSSGTKVATLPAWKVRWKRVCNKGACKRYGAHSGDRR